MYKLISLFRSASAYSANARIVQVAPHMYDLYICHYRVGTVMYKRGCLSELEKALFSFTPLGYGGRPVLWKKVQSNGY